MRTRDGRRLAVREGGDREGFLVLLHGGTPSSRLMLEGHLADARFRGIRLVTYDRPGYGGSTPHPGRRVADCADDVRAIAGALGAERLAVWGVSGGGPHSLACAALLPDLVVAAAAVASPAPIGAEGLDYYAGMGRDNVEDTELLRADLDAYRAKAAADREQLIKARPDEMISALESLVSPVDAAAMRAGFAAFLLEQGREGLAAGIEGWVEDGLALIRDWGFDLADIRLPVLLRHGREDRFVPVTHGEWLAARITRAEVDIREGDGHLTLVADAATPHAWLLSHARSAV